MARAAAGVLADRDGTSRPVAVVGRDPRASGEMLEAAVVAGLTSAGADVLRVGVAADAGARPPHRRSTGADLGVMLSASHNPMPDNGIKLFSRGGHKLPDARRGRHRAHRRQRRLRRPPADRRRGRPRPRPARTPPSDYVAHLLSTVDRPLTGLTRRRRLRARGRRRRRARGLPPRRRDGHAIGCDARRLEHQRRHRLHPPRAADRGRPRARAPTSASPTTATPTAAWPSPPTARSSTATRSWPSARWRCTSAARCRTTPSSPRS